MRKREKSSLNRLKLSHNKHLILRIKRKTKEKTNKKPKLTKRMTIWIKMTKINLMNLLILKQSSPKMAKSQNLTRRNQKIRKLIRKTKVVRINGMRRIIILKLELRKAKNKPILSNLARNHFR